MEETLLKFTRDGKFLMLAFDQRESFLKMINPDDPQNVNPEAAIALKKQIIDSVRDQFSALLVDVEMGLKAYEPRDKPFLLPIEKTGYKEVEGERLQELEYDAETLKGLGASAAKLLLYFNPNYISSKSQLEVAREVMHDAMLHNLPLFIEIVVYDKDRDLPLSERVDLELRSIELFLNAGVRPDVFKLQYPGSSEACKKVTKLLGKTPWIILTGGVDFDEFKPQLQEAIAAGAMGFLAGRALWKEAVSLSGVEREQFLKEVLPARFKEVSDVALGV